MRKKEKKLAKMKLSFKRLKSKQLGHMNVVVKLVKEIETLLPDTFLRRQYLVLERQGKRDRFKDSDGKIR